jgi:hypothetical protein
LGNNGTVIELFVDEMHGQSGMGNIPSPIGVESVLMGGVSVFSPSSKRPVDATRMDIYDLLRGKSEHEFHPSG